MSRRVVEAREEAGPGQRFAPDAFDEAVLVSKVVPVRAGDVRLGTAMLVGASVEPGGAAVVLRWALDF